MMRFIVIPIASAVAALGAYLTVRWLDSLDPDQRQQTRDYALAAFGKVVDELSRDEAAQVKAFIRNLTAPAEPPRELLE